MSCSTRPSPQALIYFVDKQCGTKITQDDWHSLRTLAENSDPDWAKSRRVATESEIIGAVNSLASAVADENGANIDIEGERHYIDDWVSWDGTTGDGANPWSPKENQFNAEDFAYEASQLVKTLKDTKVTVGSLAAVYELTNYGVAEGLEKARDETARRKLTRAIRAMSDEDLIKFSNESLSEVVVQSGPLGESAEKRIASHNRFIHINDEMTARGLSGFEGRTEVAQSLDVSPEVLTELSRDNAGIVRGYVAANPNTPRDVRATLISDTDDRVRAMMARSETDSSFLETLSKDGERNVRLAVAENKNTPNDILMELAKENTAIGVRARIVLSIREEKAVKSLLNENL
jgi:hypothetical protein